MTTTSFYSYATLVTPGHTDIETIVEALCSIGIVTDRIAVHPQTVNVTGITPKEEAQLSMADPELPSGGNLLRTSH